MQEVGSGKPGRARWALHIKLMVNFKVTVISKIVLQIKGVHAPPAPPGSVPAIPSFKKQLGHLFLNVTYPEKRAVEQK
jgi:hypothetical protein